MKVSEKGIAFIKKWEGCRLDVYKDTAGIKTIGWGHAYWKGADHITQKEADLLLEKDLVKFELEVSKYDPYYHFNQHEFDAMVSFAFNVGSIRQLTSDGTRTREQIAEKIPAYCNSGGKKIAGLVKRRNEEADIFVNGYVEDVSRETLTLEQVADKVIAGEYGNGDERKRKLEAEGYDYRSVQDIVNSKMQKLDVNAAAERVIRGDYGNGEERKRKLEAEGYNYKEVQAVVNRLLK